MIRKQEPKMTVCEPPHQFFNPRERETERTDLEVYQTCSRRDQNQSGSLVERSVRTSFW